MCGINVVTCLDHDLGTLFELKPFPDINVCQFAHTRFSLDDISCFFYLLFVQVQFPGQCYINTPMRIVFIACVNILSLASARVVGNFGLFYRAHTCATHIRKQ